MVISSLSLINEKVFHTSRSFYVLPREANEALLQKVGTQHEKSSDGPSSPAYWTSCHINLTASLSWDTCVPHPPPFPHHHKHHLDQIKSQKINYPDKVKIKIAFRKVEGYRDSCLALRRRSAGVEWWAALAGVESTGNAQWGNGFELDFEFCL